MPVPIIGGIALTGPDNCNTIFVPHTTLNLSEILSSTNADGGSYSWFNVYDATGGNNFVKNGVEIDASAGAWISSSDLANTTIKGDSQASEQTLYFQTYDGADYSAWDSVILTTSVEI